MQAKFSLTDRFCGFWQNSVFNDFDEIEVAGIMYVPGARNYYGNLQLHLTFSDAVNVKISPFRPLLPKSIWHSRPLWIGQVPSDQSVVYSNTSISVVLFQ